MYSKEVDIVLRTVFAALICLNITGNILVCLVVRRFPFMKTPMNYLLVHLAVCDMLVGLFLFPRHVLFGLYEHPDGLTGDLLCRFVTDGNVAWLSMSVSVYTLIIIAWERYNAIMKPFESRMSKRYLRYAIVMCWVFGALVNLHATVVLEYNPRIKSCDYIWKVEWGRKLDGVLWLTAYCCLPFLVMLGLYGSVIRKIWFQNEIADVSQRSLQLSRKRITKTAVTVTIIFFLCVMPHSLYYFIVMISPQQSTRESLKESIPVFFPISHVLLFLNSCINPVVYALTSTRFRRCMSFLLCGGLRNGQRIRNSFELHSSKNDKNRQESGPMQVSLDQNPA